MLIIENFLESKYDDISLCEDGIFHNENFIAVIDGVTPKGKIKWNGQTSGFHAKEVILKGLAELSGKETAPEALGCLNSLLYKEYGDRSSFFYDNPEERLQATLVIYNIYHREIWCFGDCQFIINDEVFVNEMRIDILLAELRSVYLQLEIRRGKTIQELCENDPSHNIILPILKNQFLFSNCDCEYGFSVLDGFCSDYSKAVIKKIPPNSLLVLASDGYPKLMPTLELSEAELDAVKRDDPLCISKFKSTRGFTDGKKSLDDRAYIRFRT